MATYSPPGVSVRITSERVVPSLISNEEAIFILGESSIFPETGTETVRLEGASNVPLTREGIDDPTITVQRRATPSVNLAEGVD